MSAFKAEVFALTIEPHPGADRLEIAKIGDFKSIVGKGQFKNNSLVVYIPESSIVPNNILEEINLVGKLAGSNKNRVKAMKLRGIMSQGLVYPAKPEWTLGQDVTELLGITKYEPPIPAALSGDVNSHPDVKLNFDIENIKRYPNVFQDGEEVVFTEKIHGTFLGAGLVQPENRREDMLEGKLFVSSKGIAKQGLYFKDNEKNVNNVYLRAAKQFNLGQFLENIKENLTARPNRHWNMAAIETIWVMGEVFGIQNLTYGATKNHPSFRAFGIKVGHEFVSRDVFEALCNANNVEFAPVLYRGPFNKEVLAQYTDGKETVSGNSMHIREGVVITPVIERGTGEIGRAILKSVSDAYLNQSDGEELA